MGATCGALSLYVPYYKGERDEMGKRHGIGFELMRNGDTYQGKWVRINILLLIG